MIGLNATENSLRWAWHRYMYKMAKKSYGASDAWYKLVIIGDGNTGKTCLVECFAGGQFCSVYIPTIGVDFKIHTVELDGFKIKLQIWDTTGNPRIKAITSAFFRGALGMIVTFSVTKKETFHNVAHWIQEVKQFGPPGVKLIIVGTGCDRKDREVDYFTARDFANEQQLSFFEVSANDGTNVELAFLTLVQEIRQSLHIPC